MNKKGNEINRLIYWIQTIKSYIKNPMIILVGTHLDQIDIKSKSNSNIIEEIYDNISNKCGISKEFIIGVSCKYGTNYDKLIQIIKYLSLNEIENEIRLPPTSSN